MRSTLGAMAISTRRVNVELKSLLGPKPVKFERYGACGCLGSLGLWPRPLELDLGAFFTSGAESTGNQTRPGNFPRPTPIKA